MTTHATKQQSTAEAVDTRRLSVMYARVSSKEQEQGYSIPAQLDLLRPYATQIGVGIAEEFLDAETAKTTESCDTPYIRARVRGSRNSNRN